MVFPRDRPRELSFVIPVCSRRRLSVQGRGDHLEGAAAGVGALLRGGGDTEGRLDPGARQESR